jgi:hypothetical protein
MEDGGWRMEERSPELRGGRGFVRLKGFHDRIRTWHSASLQNRLSERMALQPRRAGGSAGASPSRIAGRAWIRSFTGFHERIRTRPSASHQSMLWERMALQPRRAGGSAGASPSRIEGSGGSFRRIGKGSGLPICGCWFIAGLIPSRY